MLKHLLCGAVKLLNELKIVDTISFGTETSDFEVKITYPEKFVLASSGVQTECEDYTVCKAEHVRDFCLVLSEKFEVLSKEAFNF